MKGVAAGEILLVIGLLLLAWMVWAQQEELNRLATLVGNLAAKADMNPVPPAATDGEVT